MIVRESEIGGVIPILQTPFHDDESIDYDVLAREISWAFDRGAFGVAIAMVSEVLRLSTDERESLAAFVCREASGRGPAVISVGAESSIVAERLSRHAMDVGASAVMAIPPTTTKQDDEQLYNYFHRLITSVAIPTIVQDASGYVGTAMSVAFQTRLCLELGDHIYFKPESPPIGQRVSELRDRTGGKARIFDGSGGLHLIDSFRRGIVGTMPGTEVVDVIVVLWSALNARDEHLVSRLGPPLMALIALQTSLDSYLAVEKYLLVKRGVFPTARMRGPVGYVIDAETRCEVDRLFNSIMSIMSTVDSA